MPGGTAYLVDGAELKCTNAVTPTETIKVYGSSDQSVGSNKMVLMDDCKIGVNLQPPFFSLCKITQKPCIPMIAGTWLFTNFKNTVNSKPTVTKDSCLICSLGGLITPESSGQGNLQKLLLLQKMGLLELLGNHSGTTCAGDPVNMDTGNYILQKTDIEIPGAYPLVFQRSYNALDERIGALGRGWIHNHSVRLDIEFESNNAGAKTQSFQNLSIREMSGASCAEVTITLEDGHTEKFKYQSSSYTNMGVTYSSLKVLRGIFEFKTKENIIYRFNQSGECIEIEDVDGNKTAYKHENGNLVSVSNCCGTFKFEYNEDKSLDSISDHSGRQLSFEYDENKMLTGVLDAAGYLRQYKYDSENRLSENINAEGIAFVKNEFDKSGRTKKQIFPDGGTMSYEYDGEMNKTIFTQQNDQQIRYYFDDKHRNIKTCYNDGYEQKAFNDKGQVIHYADKNRNLYSYDYDVQGNMIKETNPMEYEQRFFYTDKGKLKKLIQYDGSQIVFRYNEKEQLTEAVDPMGYKTELRYEKRNLPNKVIMPDKSEVSFKYDERMNITEITDSFGAKTVFKYNELNRIVETVSPNKNITCYLYDDQGNITEVVNAAGDKQAYEYNRNGRVIKETDCIGAVTETEYNPLGKPSCVTDPEGNKTKYEYDKMWNICKETLPNGCKTEFEYNKLNKLSKITNGLGASIEYEYDPNGNKTKEYGPGGEITEFVYDSLNQLTCIIEPNGAKTRMEYDKMGRVTKTIDPLFHEHKTEYNAAGQKVKETDKAGNITRYEYTPLGKVSKIINHHSANIEYQYLPGGYLSKVILPDGKFLLYRYDNEKNIIQQKNEQGYNLDYTYDCLNRMIKMQSSKGEEKSFTYDAVGNVTSVTDSKGNKTRFEYTKTRKLKKVINPIGVYNTYDYDELGLIKEWKQYDVPDIMNLNEEQREMTATYFEKNLLGQVTSVTDALGNTKKFIYDERGKLTQKIDQENRDTFFKYSHSGDLEEITYQDRKSVRYKYNELRQLTAIEDWLGEILIETDELGRAKKVTDHKNRDVSYTYNSTGQVESITYPDGTVTKYEYDDSLHLKKIKDKNKVIEYEYDGYGYLKSRKLPNGITTTYSNDERGFLTKLNHEQSGKILDSFSYIYDTESNRTKIRKHRKDFPEQSGTYEYVYDKLNQLTEVKKDGNVLREYQYDSRSNRSYMRNGDIEEFYTYNEANQLVSSQKGGTTTSYQYDKCGNIKKKTEGTNVFDYVFNSQNSLSHVMSSKGILSQYIYNGMGHRVEAVHGKADTNKWTRIYAAPGHEYDPIILFDEESEQSHTDYVLDYTKQYDNLLMRSIDGHAQRYLWDTKPILLEDDAGSERYFCNDELGSPIRLTGNRGHYDSIYSYDEFGNDTSRKRNWDEQPFGFTGYQFDEHNSLYFAQARYYSSVNSRFIQEDPIKSGVNWYSYCGNNPINYIDPFGLEKIIISGGYMGDGYNHQLSFIDSALSQVHDWRNMDETVTLLVPSNGKLSESDMNRIESYTKSRGVEVKPFSSSDDIISYINNGSNNDRGSDKITDVRVFAHGYKGSIEFGHGLGLSSEEQKKLSLTKEQVENKMNANAFNSAYSHFYSCNTGTGGADSFAQSWSNITGGKTKAAEGFTQYSDINSFKWYNVIGWYTYSKLRKNYFGGYDVPSPSLRYPGLASGAKWKTFKPNNCE